MINNNKIILRKFERVIVSMNGSELSITRRRKMLNMVLQI